MPKTRDAFALRDFDPQRILQRKIFDYGECEFTLFVRTDKVIADDEALEIYFDYMTVNPSLALPSNAGVQLKDLHRLQLIAREYTRKLLRHYNLLEKFFHTADTKGKFDRIWQLRQCYAIAIGFLGKFQKKLNMIGAKLNAKLDALRAESFRERLRLARKTAGFTQIEVAARLKSSLNKYASYEQGRSQPSLPTLIRLCEILGTDANTLLGISPS